MTTYKVGRQEGAAPMPWWVVVTEEDGRQRIHSGHRTRALAQLAIVKITLTRPDDETDP